MPRGPAERCSVAAHATALPTSLYRDRGLPVTAPGFVLSLVAGCGTHGVAPISRCGLFVGR